MKAEVIDGRGKKKRISWQWMKGRLKNESRKEDEDEKFVAVEGKQIQSVIKIEKGKGNNSQKSKERKKGEEKGNRGK